MEDDLETAPDPSQSPSGLLTSPWFGLPWAANFCRRDRWVPTPTGHPCAWCAEAIGVGDIGLLIVACETVSRDRGTRPIHSDCFVRLTAGGANHQRQLCTCFGTSTPADPPSLTRREAASVAAKTLARRLRCAPILPAGSLDPPMPDANPSELGGLQGAWGEGIAACVLGFDGSCYPHDPDKHAEFARGRLWAAQTAYFEIITEWRGA